MDDYSRQVLANDRQLNGGKGDNRELSPGKVLLVEKGLIAR